MLLSSILPFLAPPRPKYDENWKRQFFLSRPTGICQCRIGEYCPHIEPEEVPITVDRRWHTIYIHYKDRAGNAITKKIKMPKEPELKLSDIPSEVFPSRGSGTSNPRLASLKKGTILTMTATEEVSFKNTKGEDKVRTLIVCNDGKKYLTPAPIFKILKAALGHVTSVAKDGEVPSVEFSITFNDKDRVGVA